jgi:hypothetical protein
MSTAGDAVGARFTVPRVGWLRKVTDEPPLTLRSGHASADRQEVSSGVVG